MRPCLAAQATKFAYARHSAITKARPPIEQNKYADFFFLFFCRLNAQNRVCTSNAVNAKAARHQPARPHLLQLVPPAVSVGGFVCLLISRLEGTEGKGGKGPEGLAMDDKRHGWLVGWLV